MRIFGNIWEYSGIFSSGTVNLSYLYFHILVVCSSSWPTFMCILILLLRHMYHDIPLTSVEITDTFLSLLKTKVTFVT